MQTTTNCSKKQTNNKSQIEDVDKLIKPGMREFGCMNLMCHIKKRTYYIHKYSVFICLTLRELLNKKNIPSTLFFKTQVCLID